MARAKRSEAGAFPVPCPLVGWGGAQEPLPFGLLCPHQGAGTNRLAAQRHAGAVQPRSVRWSVAALTGPRALR